MQSQQQKQCQSVRKLKQEIEKLDTPFTQVRRLKTRVVEEYPRIIKAKLELMGQLKDKYPVGSMTVQSKKFIENNKNSIENFMESFKLQFSIEGEEDSFDFNKGIWVKERKWPIPAYKDIYDVLNELYDYVYSEEDKMCPCDA